MRVVTYNHLVYVFFVIVFFTISYTCFNFSHELARFCALLVITSVALLISTFDNKTILLDFRDDNPRYTKDDLEKHMLKGFEEGYKKGQEEANG